MGNRVILLNIFQSFLKKVHLVIRYTSIVLFCIQYNKYRSYMYKRKKSLAKISSIKISRYIMISDSIEHSNFQLPEKTIPVVTNGSFIGLQEEVAKGNK